ncbi:MAG TPA: metalloregulator ArsR/SmtB family transcription factor [Kofleriaceae bacterium]|nr:metalloregulator ArsR/SmtB family transcription factor [Kofleriaceae bacterium]
MQNSLDDTFAALADPTRRAVIALLREKPLRSSDMAAALSTSRPAMSRHLGVLRRAGLVEEESPDDDARVRVYQLCREPFSELRTWLDEVEEFWTDQLAAFKAHAEGRARRRR